MKFPITLRKDLKPRNLDNITLCSTTIFEQISIDSPKLFTWKCSNHETDHIWEAKKISILKIGCPFSQCAESPKRLWKGRM